MRLVYTKHNKTLIIILYFLFLSNCQLQESKKTHGINFLENRTNALTLNKTNKNDVVKIIGRPHTISTSNENKWIYIERTLKKGSLHKLGQNILKENNVLELTFNKYGVLKEKNFYKKDNMKKVTFSKKETQNNVSQTSFVNNFLSSIRQKMYGNKNK
jgi:outer membrane protein assembly factor BamE (lipoprotein component of BamABCDE complex)